MKGCKDTNHRENNERKDLGARIHDARILAQGFTAQGSRRKGDLGWTPTSFKSHDFGIIVDDSGAPFRTARRTGLGR